MDFSELVYIDDTGYHYPDYPTTLAWLQDKYRTIYGADVYLESDSQDGQFLADLAKTFYDMGTRGAAIYASLSPSTGQGAGLSRTVKINGLNRLVPSFSTVTLTIVGVAGTVILNGIAQDTLQQKWILPASVTIPGGGSIAVSATAELVGAVTAEIGTVTGIFTPTQGWQTVNNAAAATPGAPVETDAALRARQALSTANPSLTVLEGTVGGVANLTGVTKIRSYENDADTADGNGLPGHSICIVVAGGVTADIADEIALHKTPGTQTYGDTNTLVYDDHGMPLNIKFQRALTATIKVNITVSVLPGWSLDFVALIQAAIAAQINSGQIGDTVVLNKIYAAAYLGGTAPGQTFIVTVLTIGKNAVPPAASNITLLFYENPVCTAAVDVVVTPA